MITSTKVKELLTDMESDRIERPISVKEDKLGPAVCALANDFPNHKQPGYILWGVKDNGSIAGMTWSDEELQKIGNVKTNGNVLPQPSLVVSEVFKFSEGEVVIVEVKPSLYPPVRYDGRCWIRVGPRRAKATIEEERILIERRANYAKMVNPGGLYGDVNAGNFPNAGDYRNVVIAEAMKRLGYVNRFNYGVKRAIDELNKNGNGNPEFDLMLATKFKVVVPINQEW